MPGAKKLLVKRVLYDGNQKELVMADGQIVQRVAAKALVVDDEGKVLILREASTYVEGTNVGKYGTPGGRLEPGEPFMEALRREVREECGLEVEIGRPVHVDEWSPVIKGVPNHIVGMFLRCRPRPGEIRLSEEHDDYKWVRPEEADNFTLNVADRNAIRALEA
jgi:8-oxo-dGTP diphosphatase